MSELTGISVWRYGKVRYMNCYVQVCVYIIIIYVCVCVCVFYPDCVDCSVVLV